MSGKINIVVPMAGAGSRFAKAGYKNPKPLIRVLGKPMIKLVIENLTPRNFGVKFIFLTQQTHIDTYGVDKYLQEWAPGCEVVPVNGLTEGAACTVLLAREYISNDAPLLMANCDQYIDCRMDNFISEWFNHAYDGMIMTMKANDPKWSFVGFDSQGKVEKVVEKKVISDEATVGIYGFMRGRDFVESADSMIAANDRVNNEFYVAPAYNYMVQKGASIGIFNIGRERDGMYGLGIPQDLEYFETLDLAKTVCEE